MLQSVRTAILAFIGTTMDDLLLVVLLFTQAKGTKDRFHVRVGEYLGVFTVTCAGFLCALAAGLLPQRYLRLLGLIPLAMSVLCVIQELRKRTAAPSARFSPGVISTALLSISSGGDNIAVYASSFAGYTAAHFLCTACVFAVCLAVMCALASAIAAFAPLRRTVEKVRPVLIPLVLAVLGLTILF